MFELEIRVPNCNYLGCSKANGEEAAFDLASLINTRPAGLRSEPVSLIGEFNVSKPIHTLGLDSVEAEDVAVSAYLISDPKGSSTSSCFGNSASDPRIFPYL